MHRSLSFARRLTLVVGLALSVAACIQTTASRPGAPALQTTPSQPQPLPRHGGLDPDKSVMVALLAPLTASDAGVADVGNALANAARMAVIDLADSSMELRIYDTAGNPNTARAMAQKAVTDGASLILGPLFRANTGGVGDVAEKAGINVISFSTDSTVAGGPVFLSGFLPESESARVVSYAMSQGLDRVAVFYPQTEYGAAAVRGADNAAHARGAQVVTTAAYSRTFEGIQNASGPFSDAALSSGVTAVLLPDSGHLLRSAAAFMDFNGIDPAEVKYLGLGQWNTSVTLREPALQEGWFPAPDPDKLDLFVSLYSARFGAKPPFVAVLGYDAVQVAGQLLAGARRDGSKAPFDREQLTRAEGFKGALGPMVFKPDGLNRRAMAILKVGAGSFEVLDPAPFRLDLGS